MLSALLTKYRSAVSNNEIKEALDLRRMLEEFHPRNKEEWLQCYTFFMQEGWSVWAEIASSRFLSIDPRNVDVRISRFDYLSRLATRRQDALEEFACLQDLPISASGQALTISSALRRCKRDVEALTYLERARNLSPDDVNVVFAAVHNLINSRNMIPAKRELQKLLTRAPHPLSTSMSIVELACRVGDKALTKKAIRAALSLAQSTDYKSIVKLIAAAAEIGDMQSIEKLLRGTSFSEVWSTKEITSIFVAIRGRGFFDKEVELVAEGLRREPDNALFSAGLRSQNSSLALSLRRHGANKSYRTLSSLKDRAIIWLKDLCRL